MVDSVQHVPLYRNIYTLINTVIVGYWNTKYIGIGPYRATPTKKDAAAEIGLSGLTDIVSRAPCPSVAIGGIKAADVGSVMQSGVDGVAVVSAICGTPDIPASVKALLDAMPS